MATALGMMAFIGAGNSPWTGPYRESVSRAWEWLKKQQAASTDGALFPVGVDEATTSLSEKERAARRGHVARLNHLWGTIALLEVVTSSHFQDPNVTESMRKDTVAKRRLEALGPATAAVRFIMLDPLMKPEKFDFLNEKTANMDELVLLGAVRYMIGRHAVQVEKEWWTAGPGLIFAIQKGQPEAYVPYRYTEDGEYWFGGRISTPQAMIAFVYFFVAGSAPHRQMTKAAPLLLGRPPVWNPYYEVRLPSRHPQAGPEAAEGGAVPDTGDTLRSVTSAWKDDITNEASWFWQSMAFRAMGGEEWGKWRSMITKVLSENQQRAGADAGSWDPVGPHGRVFGREIATAWLAITMQSKCRLQMANSTWTKLLEDPRTASRNEVNKNTQVTREKCLVCDMEILSSVPNSRGVGPVKYYFCSEEHLQKFEMDPNGYINGTAPKETPGGSGEGSEGSHK